MADTAILGSRQVIGVFAAGGNTIMAGGTVAYDTGVIKHRTNKGGSVMTHPAIFSRSNMCNRLANRSGAVMAGCAITGDTVVIEDRREKRGRVMTEVTVLRGGHMVHR